MKILIIEDDSNKLKQISQFFDEYFTGKDTRYSCVVKQSFQSGLAEILSVNYDFLILDMSIPNFDITNTDDGGEPVSRGGELILNEIDRAGILLKTLIFTAYEDFDGISLASIDDKLKAEFNAIYLGCIFYNAFESSWKSELEKVLEGELL